MTSEIVAWIALGTIGVIVYLLLNPFLSLYIQTKFSMAPVPFFQILRMPFVGVDPKLVTNSHIRMVKGTPLDIPVSELVDHAQAGGHLPSVVNALIAAHRDGLGLSWEAACIADLEGRDILDEVQSGSWQGPDAVPHHPDR